MISWWGTDLYLNIVPIQTRDVVLMNAEYGSSGLFVSRDRSKHIGHNKYTGRRSNLCSKPTPIHGPVNKSYLNSQYSRSHFSWLPQAVSKGLINRLFQKVSYAYTIIDPVIIGFITNEVKKYFSYL